MNPAIPRLLADLDTARAHGDPHAVTETEYALAILYRDTGDLDSAARHAHACLAAAVQLPADSLDDVTTTRHSVGGVPLPDYLHDDVVRARLADLLHRDQPASGPDTTREPS